MRWSTLTALATAPHTVPFAALRAAWDLLPEHFPAIQATLAVHGWTVLAEPAAPAVAPAPVLWDAAPLPTPLNAMPLTGPAPTSFVPDPMAWIHLVPPEAHRYVGPSFPFDDAFQEGVLGLLHAIQRFDPTGGFDFVTKARWQIRQAIRRALPHYAPMVIPRRWLALRSRVEQARWILTPTLGHEPDATELAQWLDLPYEQVCTVLALDSSTDSLDRPRFADGPLTLGDTLADPTATDFLEPPDAPPQLSEADALQWLLHHGFTVDTIAAATQRDPAELLALAADWLPSVS